MEASTSIEIANALREVKFTKPQADKLASLIRQQRDDVIGEGTCYV